jgi:hypothetical protein
LAQRGLEANPCTTPTAALTKDIDSALKFFGETIASRKANRVFIAESLCIILSTAI